MVNEKEQPLMKLEVTPRPVVRQEMQLPKTQFNERETLTIVCQFDTTPEEPFTFLHNDQPIIPNSHISTTIEDNKYTIIVKDLRPEEDEGVYTLQSDHLIRDKPSITVISEEKKSQTQSTTDEIEEILIVISKDEQPKTIFQEVEEVMKATEDKKVGFFLN